jgi:flagellar biosynthesis protein FlhA
MVLDPATGLDARIASIRSHVATHFGFVLPEIRLTDDPKLPAGAYRIRIQGVEQARDVLRPGRILALPGESTVDLPGDDVREPVYGASARWIPVELQDTAAMAGITVVTPSEVLATHLLEIVKTNLGRLMTLRSLRRLLDAFAQPSDPTRAAANRRLLDELVPDRVPVDLLLSVLKLLLEEGVSIRNLPLVLEAIAEARQTQGTPEAVCEHVRRRLGFQIVAGLRRPDGSLPLVQLAPEWESTFTRFQIETERGLPEVALPGDLFNRLVQGLGDKIARAAEAGGQAIVVTSATRRRFVRSVIAAKGWQIPVLSYDEIGAEPRAALVGVVAA